MHIPVGTILFPSDNPRPCKGPHMFTHGSHNLDPLIQFPYFYVFSFSLLIFSDLFHGCSMRDLQITNKSTALLQGSWSNEKLLAVSALVLDQGNSPKKMRFVTLPSKNTPTPTPPPWVPYQDSVSGNATFSICSTLLYLVWLLLILINQYTYFAKRS